jgi:hypothetical protein
MKEVELWLDTQTFDHFTFKDPKQPINLIPIPNFLVIGSLDSLSIYWRNEN